MKAQLRWAMLSAVILMLVASSAGAGSIWAKAQSRIRPLHTDDTARAIGDILTVVISEHSVIENETTRALAKSSSRDFSTSGDLPVRENSLLKSLNWFTGRLFNLSSAEFELDTENKFDGSAEYDTDRKIADKMTVTVMDVLPNGNLVVVGSCQRAVVGDTRILDVSGVVRPSDVTFANTVRSDQVADFRIAYRHKGQENSFTKPGWLEWILNRINPF